MLNIKMQAAVSGDPVFTFISSGSGSPPAPVSYATDEGFL